MKVYISGQITGLAAPEYERLFNAAQAELESQGHDPINPLFILPYHPTHTWEQYMIEDIKALFSCDAIYMLKNWPHSRGARIERAIAHELGIKIMYQ